MAPCNYKVNGTMHGQHAAGGQDRPHQQRLYRKAMIVAPGAQHSRFRIALIAKYVQLYCRNATAATAANNTLANVVLPEPPNVAAPPVFVLLEQR